MGGGKGGIGKTVIAANLGTLLARQGKRVLLLDLDLGASNLHSFMGAAGREKGLECYLDKAIRDLGEAAVATGIPNLWFIGSQGCGTEAANLHTAQKSKVIRAVQSLDYDYIFMDLGAGTHFNMLDFFLIADQGICILTPEPTAIENTFTFIKAMYFRVVKRALKLSEFNRVTRSLDLSGNSMGQSFKIISAVSDQDPETGDLLKRKLNEFHFQFVLNQVRGKDDPELGAKIQGVCRRHFHSRFSFLGNVRYDEQVRDAILTERNFVTAYARAGAANDLARIARNIMRADYE